MPFLQNCEVSGDPEMLELMLQIKNQNEELLSEVKNLKTKSDSLINELKNSTAKQEELLLKVNSLQTELVKILSQINILTEKLNSQNADLESIKKQLTDLQEKYQAIIIQLEQLQKLSQILAEIEKLKGQLSDLDGKYQVILGSLGQNKEALDSLKAQIASIQEQLTLNLTKIGQLTSQLGEQGTNIEEILAQIKELKANCDELKSLLESLLSGKSPIPTSGLVGWWPFNGNANDESGNNNNGILNGPTLALDRFQKEGKAYNFDGINDFIRISNSPSLNNKAVSISGWFKTNNLPTNEAEGAKAIVGKWWQSPSTCNGNYNAFLVVLTKPVVGPVLGGATSFYAGNNFYTSQLIESNKWIHFVFVHDSNTGGKIYLNGQLSNSNQLKGDICNSTNPLNIGADSKAGEIYRFFNGTIDDIAIWNRVLTAEEISKIYRGDGF